MKAKAKLKQAEPGGPVSPNLYVKCRIAPGRRTDRVEVTMRPRQSTAVPVLPYPATGGDLDCI
jgi:hypothetical protein